jgi:transitional endoplasmic reticulum ATPase
MRHLTRPVSAFFLRFVLASVLYGWARSMLHVFASGRPMHLENRALMLGVAVALAALFWLLYRRYRFVRQIALFMLGLAVLHLLVQLDQPGLAAVTGCLALALAARIWYRRTHQCSTSTRGASSTGDWRNSYFQAVYPRAASPACPAQPAMPASAPGQVRSVEPAYSFDDLVAKPRFNFSSIVGMADTKARLLGAAREILGNPARARNGILLFGEPGNGKTMFAEALAGELGVPFFTLDYGSVASKWINETPAKVKAAFAQALSLGHGVFFVDELDSYVKHRGDSTHQMDRDLTNVMLTEIVRLRGTRIILVAATNSISALDPASIREGRFDFKVEALPPCLEAREAILRRSVGEAMGFQAMAAPVLANLAARWEGFSAARLAAVGRELADMRREGIIGEGNLSFDIAMRAMRRIQGSKGGLPENVRSIDAFILPEVALNYLHDLAFRLQHAYSLERLGGSLPRGVLFYGPPGTGKTQAAMALAKASGCAFLKTTGAELLSNPASWDKLIRDAKDLRPAIVFIDEADDVLGERRMSGVAPVTNKVLTTLDGADGRVHDVLYICATNHPALDPAVLRGGRLEEKVAFSVPEHEALMSYVRMRFKVMAGDVFAVSRHTMDCAVTGLKGHSIADADAVLQRIIDAAAVRHLREGTAVITAEDVRSALSALRGTASSY